MLAKKKLRIINIILIIACSLLFLNLLGVKLPTYGLAVEKLDTSPFVCLFSLEGRYTELTDLDRCCFELQKQLRCQDHFQQINNFQIQKRCYIDAQTPQYFVNLKTYRHCQNEGYQIN